MAEGRQGGISLQRIIVIGGGVVGLSSAVALARGGHRVTVLDAGTGREASSWNNAGHIAVEQVAPLASIAAIRSAPGRLFARGGALDLPFGMASAWLPFAARMLVAARPAGFRSGRTALGALLAEAMPAWRRSAAADLVREEGHLVGWESAATAADGRAAWHSADTGVATVADSDVSVFAGITDRVVGAIRFAGSGQIADLSRLADRLEAALYDAGGTIVRGCANLSIEDGAARVEGHDADLVLVAAGVRSRVLMEATGHRAPMIAERGYHIRAAAGRWPRDLPPVVFEDRSLIVTRYGDVVQASSFVELGNPDAPADPRKWQRLEEHVAALGLPMAAPFTRWMGSRPTLPDYLPAIGRSRHASNLLYAFGHQHLGLTLAPITADIVTALVAGKEPFMPIAPFDIARFGSRR